MQSEPGNTANHANRSNFARNVLNAPDGYVGPFSEAVATSSGVTTQSGDSDVQFTINAMWDAMAGTV